MTMNAASFATLESATLAMDWNTVIDICGGSHNIVANWIWCDCGPQRWSVEVDFDDQTHRDVIADDVRRLLGDGFEKATVWI